VKRKNIWSITAGSNVPSTFGRYVSNCVDGPRAIHKCCSAMHQWTSRLSHMLLQKYSVMQHIFAYNGLPREGEDTTQWLTFLDSSHRVDVKLQLTQNATTFPRYLQSSGTNWCLRGQKWSTRSPLLTPHLETPKDMATKRGDDLSGWQIYCHANFHVDQSNRRRDICPRTKKYTHTRFSCYSYGVKA